MRQTNKHHQQHQPTEEEEFRANATQLLFHLGSQTATLPSRMHNTKNVLLKDWHRYSAIIVQVLLAWYYIY